MNHFPSISLEFRVERSEIEEIVFWGVGVGGTAGFSLGGGIEGVKKEICWGLLDWIVRDDDVWAWIGADDDVELWFEGVADTCVGVELEAGVELETGVGLEIGFELTTGVALKTEVGLETGVAFALAVGKTGEELFVTADEELIEFPIDELTVIGAFGVYTVVFIVALLWLVAVWVWFEGVEAGTTVLVELESAVAFT